MRRTVNFWRDLAPLVLRFCRETRTPFNEVVNRAVASFLCVADVVELQLLARREALLREEGQLRRVCNAMLRSGSYLPGYVKKVLMEPERPLGFLQDAQKPLKALNPNEERVFRKIAGRREMIAKELAEIEMELLKDVRPFRLKPEPRSWSRARDRIKHDGGECSNGKVAEDG